MCIVSLYTNLSWAGRKKIFSIIRAFAMLNGVTMKFKNEIFQLFSQIFLENRRTSFEEISNFLRILISGNVLGIQIFLTCYEQFSLSYPLLQKLIKLFFFFNYWNFLLNKKERKNKLCTGCPKNTCIISKFYFKKRIMGLHHNQFIHQIEEIKRVLSTTLKNFNMRSFLNPKKN